MRDPSLFKSRHYITEQGAILIMWCQAFSSYFTTIINNRNLYFRRSEGSPKISKEKTRKCCRKRILTLPLFWSLFLAYFLHYACFIAFYHFVVYNVFDFPRRGEPLPMIVFAVVFLSASINLGMVLSQVFSRRETGMQIFLFLSIPILFLSNFSWPRYLIPDWMAALSAILPSSYAVPAWLSIQQMGAGIQDASVFLVKMGVQSVIYLGLGLLLSFLRDKSKLKTGDM